MRITRFFVIGSMAYFLFMYYSCSSPYFAAISFRFTRSCLWFVLIVMALSALRMSSVRKNSYGGTFSTRQKLNRVSADIHFLPFSILLINVCDFSVNSENAICERLFLLRNNRRLLPNSVRRSSGVFMPLLQYWFNKLANI